MVEKGLFQLITQDADVQSAIGTDKNGVTQCFWVKAQDGAQLPYLILSKVATTDLYSMAGTVGMRNALFQATAYATTYYASREATDLVRKAIENFTGTLPDGTVVDAVFIEKDWDMHYVEGSKNWVYGAYLQFRVWYLEA